MKKIIGIGILIGAFNITFSQKGGYISFGSGIAFSGTKDVVGVAKFTDSGGNFKNTNVYSSFGKGIPLTIRVGFKYNLNFGVELGVNYLIGFNQTITTSKGGGLKGYVRTKSRQIRAMPGVVFTTNITKLTFYGKLGLILPIGSTINFEQYSATSITESVEKKEETQLFNIGYFGAFGTIFSLTDKVKLFTELEGINLRIKQKTATVTAFTINGNDQIGSLSVQQKETEYVNELNSTDNINTNEPKKVLATMRNFNSFALHIGLILNF